MLPQNPILTYLFFGLAVISVALWSLSLIPATVLTTLLGVFGFAGIAGLRAFIEAQGWKTYFSVGAGAVGVVAQFFWPEIVTPENLAVWLSTWGIIAAGGLTHATTKLYTRIKNGYFNEKNWGQIGQIGDRG